MPWLIHSPAVAHLQVGPLERIDALSNAEDLLDIAIGQEQSHNDLPVATLLTSITG